MAMGMHQLSTELKSLFSDRTVRVLTNKQRIYNASSGNRGFEEGLKKVAKSRTRLSNWTELNWKKGKGFPGGSVVRICLPMQETQETWVPSLGQEDSPEGGNGNLLQYSYPENSIDRGAWWAIVHQFAESWTWLSDWAQEAKQGKRMKCIVRMV